MNTPRPTRPACYRIVRIADPRSRGACAWYEVEGIAADGSRSHVATCDDRREARDLVQRLEAHEARQAAAAAELDARRRSAGAALAAARSAAESLQLYRRAAAAREGSGAAWVAHRDRWPSLVADRAAAAAALRQARADFDTAWNDDADIFPA
jgi:hypothetical protein